MSARAKRVPAHLQLHLSAKTHVVHLQLKPGVEALTIHVIRDDAKGSHRMELSLTAARDLQRALQGAVDEGYRLQAEREHKRKLPADLRQVVDEVARNLPAGNYEAKLTASGVEVSEVDE